MPDHVLVPVDGSPQSWDALDYAFAQFPDAKVTALHVTDPMDWVYTDMEGGYFSAALQDQADEFAGELLEKVEARAREAGADIETATELGRPARAIVEYAEDHGVDHVVMGSHGRSGLDRVLLGSVAENVIRRSDVPVTVVR